MKLKFFHWLIVLSIIGFWACVEAQNDQDVSTKKEKRVLDVVVEKGKEPPWPPEKKKEPWQPDEIKPGEEYAELKKAQKHPEVSTIIQQKLELIDWQWQYYLQGIRNLELEYMTRCFKDPRYVQLRHKLEEIQRESLRMLLP